MSALGNQATFAINSGTVLSPTLQKVALVKDVSLNLGAALADITTRASKGVRLQRVALKEITVDAQMLYDPDDDADYSYFESAYHGKDQVLVSIVSGDIDVPGTYKVLHAAWNVSQFTENQPLEDAIMADITLVPDLEEMTNAPPDFTTITVS